MKKIKFDFEWIDLIVFFLILGIMFAIKNLFNLP